jgi:hypothetical protein
MFVWYVNGVMKKVLLYNLVLLPQLRRDKKEFCIDSDLCLELVLWIRELLFLRHSDVNLDYVANTLKTTESYSGQHRPFRNYLLADAADSNSKTKQHTYIESLNHQSKQANVSTTDQESILWREDQDCFQVCGAAVDCRQIVFHSAICYCPFSQSCSL